MAKEKGLHDDHRERMRNRFMKNGLDSFEEHQILEMILYSCIPRRDTNETAHCLLRRFGNLSGVLSASNEELCSVDGIGKTSAAHLHFLGETFGYMTDRIFRTIPLKTRDCIAAYAAVRLGSVVKGSAEAAFTDADGMLVGTLSLYRGERNRTHNIVKAVLDEAARCHAYGIVLIHDHKGEPLIPSPDDDAITATLRREAEVLGITSVEHVIISDEGYIFI